MNRQIRGKRRSVAEINVVPYIDVMLVLLVIFMITTPLLTQGVNINLPQAAAKPIETAEQTPIIVSIDKAGNYYLNSDTNPELPLAAEKMATQVAAQLILAKQNNIKKPVLVKGDEEVNYGFVMTAMAILQRAGVTEVGLLTQAPTQKQRVYKVPA